MAGSSYRYHATYPDRPERAAGDLTHCADRIASLASQGIDHVILSFPAEMTPDRQDTISRQLLAAVTDRLT